MTDTPRSETPRVDRLENDSFNAMFKLARQLERENASLKAQVDIWKHRAHRAGFAELTKI